MFEDRTAVIKVHDAHAIDIYVNREVYNALLKMRPDLLSCMDGIAFRDKGVDPPT